MKWNNSHGGVGVGEGGFKSVWTGDEKMGGGGLCFVLPAKPVICALTSSGKHGASKWVLGSP